MRAGLKSKHYYVAQGIAALCGGNSLVDIINIAGKEQLSSGFSALGIDFIDSIANFITIDVGDASAINAQLLQQGVIVRPVANYAMPNHLRVTVGLEQENAQFLDVLGSIVGGQR